MAADADLLRSEVAARRFGVSSRTLRRWAAAGPIGQSRRPGMTFYVASDIAEAIAAPLVARRVVPLPPPTPVAAPADDWRKLPLWAGKRGRVAR